MHTAVRSAGAGRGEPGRAPGTERAEGRLLFFGICITFVPGGSLHAARAGCAGAPVRVPAALPESRRPGPHGRIPSRFKKTVPP